MKYYVKITPESKQFVVDALGLKLGRAHIAHGSNEIEFSGNYIRIHENRYGYDTKKSLSEGDTEVTLEDLKTWFADKVSIFKYDSGVVSEVFDKFGEKYPDAQPMVKDGKLFWLIDIEKL